MAALMAALCWQQRKINDISADRDAYKRNTGALLQDVERYKVNDSLNAARAEVLELKMSEYEKYRAEDAELIEQLQVSKRELQAVASVQTRTIDSLRGTARVVYALRPDSSGVDTTYCIDEKTRWVDLSGCLNTRDNSFDYRIETRDAIKVVSTVKYKRFLGFLWFTGRVKSREVHAVSQRPNSTIEEVEWVEIRR